MIEPEADNSSGALCDEGNEVREFDDADSLSTNENKQMDGEIEEMNEEGRQDTASGSIILELDEELQAGYKILIDLMSHAKRAANWPFMESIEKTEPEVFESYKERIEKPMWLKLMKEKFEKQQYATITEFVSDFRIMLENCYRFNGPDHYISKRAQKMETMLEQKLALLPREFREKTTIDATTEQKPDISSSSTGLRRRPKSHVLHDSTYLLNQLREAEYQKKREYRIRQIMARRAERQALAQEIMDWEEQVLFDGKIEQMRAMWEIPQIGLFLFLCQEPLNIGEVMHFELERCFLISRESTTMQLIMTSLLSTPFQRLKIERKNLMPYRIWEQRLREKLRGWYKLYTDTGKDVEKTCFKLGLEEQFFVVVGKKNPLERKKYHELSFYKKVWIMKSLCDHCMHQQDYLRETIENQPYSDQREYLLGTDNMGQRYIHFPQFCGADVRVYRQAPVKYPKIDIKPDPFNSKRKFPFVYKPPPIKKVKLKKKRQQTPQSAPTSENVSPMSSPQRQRPRNLRQAPKAVVPLQLLDDASSITEDASSSSSESEKDYQSASETLEPENTNKPGTSTSGLGVKSPSGEPDKDAEQDGELDGESVDRLSSGSDATLPYCDNSDSNSNLSSRDQSRDSSPYPSCSDLNLRFGSQIDRSSDVSQESSPCPSPAEFSLRRGTRRDRFSDNSRDASPLIFDADFGLRRSSRNRARLKNIPPLKAARDLSSFLFEENSASNSSLTGDNSLTGMGSSLFKDDSTSRRSSKSSEMNEDSFDCDINVDRLFANSRTSHSSSDLGLNFLNDKFSAVSENEKKSEQGGKVKSMAEILGDENSSESSDLFKAVTNVDKKSVGLTFENIKSPKENSEFDSLSGLTSVNRDFDSSVNGSCDKNDNFKSGNPESCNINDGDEVAVATELEVEDGENNTGKEISSMSVDYAEDKSDDNNVTKAAIGHTKDLAKSEYGANSNEDRIEKPNQTSLEVSDTIETHMKDVTKPNEELETDETVETEQKSVFSEVNETSRDRMQNTDDIVKEISFGNDGDIASMLKLNDAFETNESEEVKSEPIDEKPVSYSDSKEINTGIEDEVYKVDLDLLKSNDSECKVEIKTENERISDDNIKSEIKEEPNLIDTKVEKLEEHAQIDKDMRTAKQENIDVKMEKKGDIDENLKIEKREDVKDNMEDELKREKQEESDDGEEGEEEEILPDCQQFEMVAETVEEVRKLAGQFAEPEPIIIKRGKKEQIQRPPPRKKNIVILHERLQFLLKELEPWESKLQQATKRARLRIRKEVEDYLHKPPEEKDDDWKSSDEDTESGESGLEDDDVEESKSKTKLTEDKTSAANSRCSTPVKPPEDPEEIDISHRGRLRKRRIIPNNVEDQMAIKKPKPVKIETSQITPTSNQPVIVQSGKTQLVDYADIIRQIKNTGGKTPILIKSTQGGRTVLTSVLPVNTNSNNNSSTSTIPAASTVKVVSPSSTAQMTAAGSTVSPQALKIAVHCGPMQVTSKALQHPTIQNLLSGTVAGSRLLQKTSTSISVEESVMSATEQQPIISSTSLERVTTPQKVVLPVQTTPQKVVSGPVTTPRKIAPHTTASDSSRPKAKYYAANPSTLPINVVEQLIATRGAKLSQGAFNQSILLIPMENEGQSRNVVSTAVVTPVKNNTPATTTTTTNVKIVKSENTNNVSTTAAKMSPNTPILPKPQTSPVLSLGQGISGIIQPGLAGVHGMNVARLIPLGISPKSPTRYPTNETVKTLLEKRKPLEEKEPFVLEKRKMPAVSVGKMTLTANDGLMIKTEPTSPAICGSMVNISPVHNQNNAKLGQVISESSKVNSSPPTVMRVDNLKTEALVSPLKAQQCVITSISAAKLNTLLLQTSAAGAKSIPSLIKLPSKAALDSAVKAVVTSVNITLPTVNIKVPSPTSLPSIGPRRNVTKTIQTMKSPIPVAPKFVTQSCGGQTTLTFADSNTTASSQMLTVSSSSLQTSSSSAAVSVNEPNVLTGVNQSTVLAGVNQSNITGSLDQDGKKVITRLTPQLVLTSKGVMQMGFINTAPLAAPATPTVSQVSVPSTAVQCGNQTVLIQNSAGQYQLIQQTNPLLQHASQGTSLQQLANQSLNQSQVQGQNILQTIKPVVALNASGSPIILPSVKANTTAGTSSSPPSIVLHNSTYYSANPRKPGVNSITSPTSLVSPAVGVSVNTDLKSPSPGLVLQQASSNLLQTAQRPVISQSGMVSPVLGLQQGLVLQGGVQLSNPLVNQLGLNILQPGVQTLQNTSSLQTQSLNLLQKAGTPATQLLNLNPLLLNTPLTTTSVGVLRQQLNTQLAMGSGNQLGANIGMNTVVRPSSSSLQQPLKSPVVTTAILPSTLAGGQNGTGLVSPLAQVVHMQGSSLVIPALGSAQQQLNLLGQLASTPSPAQKQLVFQYPSVGQAVTSIAAQTVQTSNHSAKLVVSLPNSVSGTGQGNTIPPVAKMQAPQITKTKLVFSDSGQSNSTNDSLLTTVAVNQVTVGQKTSPTQQKLLLFSIGGQLVTGQGVPVSLSDGVLKVVPQGKIKINNQTLTPEQIKQTLTKINEAAAMTLNPASQQQNLTPQTGATGIDQGKIIPVKIVKDDNNDAFPVPSGPSVDHTYLNSQKKKIVTSVMNGNGNGTISTVAQTKSDREKLTYMGTYEPGLISPNSQAGSQVNSDLVKVESAEESNIQGQCVEKQFGLKPMGYSSGYVVRPRTSSLDECDEKPGFAKQNYDIGKLVIDKDAKRFVIKAPVKNDLNGGGDASSNKNNVKQEARGKLEDEDEDENDDKLVIDDGVSDKEAALNLLTLANQAPAPMTVKVKNTE